MMEKTVNLRFLKVILIFFSILGSIIFFIYYRYIQDRFVERLIPITDEGGASPIFSPDGKKIAFVSGWSHIEKYQSKELWVSILEDNRWGAPKQLSKTGASGEISWSPDGEWIAYTGYRDRLCIVDMAGNERVVVKRAFYPKWSPVGDKISFFAYPEKNGEKTGLRLTNADGSKKITLVTNVGGWVDSYSWSPDGSKITYASKENGWYDLWIMDSDGGNKTHLTKSRDAIFPAWSPDGSKIAFLTRFELWVVSSDGKMMQQLTSDDGYAPDSPVWSPDGNKLAYVAFTLKNKSYDIWVINSDGSEKFELDSKDYWDAEPSWSPDGKKIAYTKNDNIWVAILK